MRWIGSPKNIQTNYMLCRTIAISLTQSNDVWL